MARPFQGILTAFACISSLCLCQDRGYANYDRIRAHFRRCDVWKGYMSGRTTVDDTYGVLNTLSLRTIRKETFMTLIKMFERAEHETGDKEYALA